MRKRYFPWVATAFYLISAGVGCGSSPDGASAAGGAGRVNGVAGQGPDISAGATSSAGTGGSDASGGSDTSGGANVAGSSASGAGGSAGAPAAGSTGAAAGSAGAAPFPPGITGKESSLWGPGGAYWNPKGDLPDFSWAGYHSSAVALPDVPQVANLLESGAKPNDEIDDAPKLQQLIDAQAARPLNQRGAILIPKGRWILSSPINLSSSGIVLRGERDGNGAPTTEFYIDPRFASANLPGSTAFFLNVRGTLSVTPIATVTANADQGSKTFSIQYTGGATLAAGSMIRLAQKEPADQSLTKYLHGFNQPASAETAALGQNKDGLFFKWYARVVSVSGSQITVDRPVPIPVSTAVAPDCALRRGQVDE